MKNRLLALVIVTAIASLAFVLMRQPRNEFEEEYNGPSYTWSDIREIYAREQRLECELERLFLFRRKLTQLKGDLLSSTRTLTDAAERLIGEAREVNPRFLVSIRARFPKQSPSLTAALILLEHLDQDARGNALTSEQIAMVDCLKSEFEQLKENRDSAPTLLSYGHGIR